MKLVVLFGGRSAEHEVSCVTAVSVLQALDPDRYEVVPVGITPAGDWVRVEHAERLVGEGAAAGLPPALRPEGPPVEPFAAIAGAVVMPLLHGPFGEDGTVQGLCELAGVPYVGSGVLGSAVAMDKLTAKGLLARAGLRTPGFFGVRADQVEADDGAGTAARVEAELGWPVFVKPSNLGSSIGVSRAADAGELHVSIELALTYDEWVVVESAVAGAREIECGVLGDLHPQASVPGEVRPSRDFYDYEDKYHAGAAELVIPAPLPDGVAEEVRRVAIVAFEALRCEGMARVDFFYADGDLLVNEVNTIPGFTPISMYPRLWEATGVPYRELLDRLVGHALDRHGRRAQRAGKARAATGGPPGT